MSLRQYVFGIAVSLLGFSVPAAGQFIVDCAPRDGMTPICGFKGSEDIEVLPGGRQLLVSQDHIELDPSGALVWQPGSIALLDLAGKKIRTLYPAGQRLAAKGGWGDANCPGEIGTALSPHGLHLSRRADGRWQLLVVNHGSRESVEMFEVTGKGRARRLAWRGCAVAPERSVLNDTAALPDGGLLVTNMVSNNDGSKAMMQLVEEAEHGVNTGNVLRWRPGTGFEVLPGSELPLPNGMQVDPAGAYLYVNISRPSGEVRKMELKTGKWVGAARVPNPDNVSWGEDGRLLVAGTRNPAEVGACMATFQVTCGAAFHVYAVDPVTMNAEMRVSHAGPPMGFASVAVEAGGDLYIGSPAGDRILRIPGAR